MSSLAVTKLPFLVISTFSVYISSTPPQAPPPVNEQIIRDFDLCEFTLARWGSSFMGKIPHSVLLAEMAVIVASLMPTNPISNSFLSTLMPNDNAANIQLTLFCQIGTLLLVSGAMIRYACYIALGELFTIDLAMRKDHKLITWGPYGWVRHPSYTGAMVVIAGMFLCITTRGSLLMESGLLSTPLGPGLVGMYTLVIAIDVVAMFRRTFMEDEIMRMRFPGEWDRWAKKVPYKLIPGVF